MIFNTQITINGNLEKGNSAPTDEDFVLPFLSRSAIVIGLAIMPLLLLFHSSKPLDIDAYGWAGRAVAAVALVAVGWFFSRNIPFPPDVDTVSFRVDSPLSFEAVAAFVMDVRQSIALGDVVLTGSEAVDRMVVRVPSGDQPALHRMMEESPIVFIPLSATDGR